MNQQSQTAHCWVGSVCFTERLQTAFVTWLNWLFTFDLKKGLLNKAKGLEVFLTPSCSSLHLFHRCKNKIKISFLTWIYIYKYKPFPFRFSFAALAESFTVLCAGKSCLTEPSVGLTHRRQPNRTCWGGLSFPVPAFLCRSRGRRNSSQKQPEEMFAAVSLWGPGANGLDQDKWKDFSFCFLHPLLGLQAKPDNRAVWFHYLSSVSCATGWNVACCGGMRPVQPSPGVICRNGCLLVEAIFPLCLK